MAKAWTWTVRLSVVITGAAILFHMAVNLGSGGKGILRIEDIFADGDSYLEYMESVTFNGIPLAIHEIRPGDNYWKIARGYGVTIDTLIGANPHWKDLRATTRQRILVPGCRGVIHLVSGTSAIEELSIVYGVDRSDIVIQDQSLPFRIKRFFSTHPIPLAVFINQAKPRSDYLTCSLARKFELRERFRSPLGGRFSSYYGTRKHPIFQVNSFHNGVDIAAPSGTPVGSAAEGIVLDAGWMGGYGKAVIVMHNDGFRTLYGHLSSIAVRPGSRVKAGTFIGRVGSTGLSTGPHLHFTLWNGPKLINPLDILW